jgi:beta-galactosidase
VLTPDRARISADGEDVSMVTVSITDAQGRPVPTAGNSITFQVEGSGRLLGLGNGDPSCHEPDKAASRSAFNGLAMALVQSVKTPGDIRLTVSSPGLEPATVVLTALAANLRPAVA